MKKIITLLLLINAIFSENLNPVIGILMLPSSQSSHPESQWSQIAASYVKYLQMGGSQVIPIHYDGDESYYDDILSKLNGVLYTGGGTDFGDDSTFGQNANYIFQKVKEINDNGTHFPLWGTCLGFEMLATYAADFEDVIGDITNEQDVTRTVKIRNDSEMINQMPKKIQKNCQKYTLQFFNHEHCLYPETFDKNSKLNSFFHLLATSENSKGDEFVSIIEAQQYPIFGTQFHPEKTSFEWRVPANHTANAIEMEQYYADFFVQHARQNDQSFSQDEFQQLSINNYQATFQPAASSFVQMYFFKNLQASEDYSIDFSDDEVIPDELNPEEF